MKNFYLLIIAILISGASFGQVTASGSGLNPTYSTLADAITALNTATITSPVAITLTGNETAPVGGYSITQLGGTSPYTITISGSSSTITAGLQSAGSQSDAIFKIVGGDYITIQNFTLQENPGNTVTTHASNTMTEFGIAIFMNSATDGAQNNTIQNNTISLSSAYQSAIAIFSTSSSSSTNGTLEASSTAGTNSNNKFYGNIINDVAYGMYFICPPITVALYESGIDIGGTSSGTANTINFGNATASTLTWNRFSAILPSGITFRNGGPGSSVRFNSITSYGLNYPQSNGIGGIVTTIGTSASGVTYTTTWSNNTINLSNSGTTAIVGVDFAYGSGLGTTICNNNIITLNNSQAASMSASIIGIKANYISNSNTANSNTITINQTFSPATTQTNSSPITGINLSGAATTLNAFLNHIIINQFNNPSSGIGTLSGALNGISATVASTTVNIGSSGNGNTITFKQGATGAGTSAYTCPVNYINAAAGHGILNIQYNNLNTAGSLLRTNGTTCGINDFATITFSLSIINNILSIDRTGPSATSGLFYGIYSIGSTGLLAGGYNINSNDITLATITSVTTYAILNLDGGTPTKNFNNNTITISGAGKTVYGIYMGIGTCNAVSNSISIASTVLSPTIYGIYAASSAILININNNIFPSITASAGSTSGPIITVIGVSVGNNNTIYSNTISSVSAENGSGNATITGIDISTTASSNIYKNKIYGLSTTCTGASTLVSGIRLSNGASNNIYNNIIGDLTASTVSTDDAIRGINITSTASSSNNNIYFNTIYLNASSTGTNFGTTGIYHNASASATTAALDLRNNIIVNTSIPNGSGFTVAYRRSSAILTNYLSTSNYNLFYAGAPGASNLIFYDGTNSDQNLSNFKTRVSPLESSSISENPYWLSTTGSSSDFVHINTTIPTSIESGGTNITSITDDFDGNTRNSSPDIGADEFAGIPLYNCSGSPAASTINAVASICSGNGTLLSLSTTYWDIGISYQWGYSTSQGGPYTNMGTNTTQSTGNLSVTTYFVCTITCSFSGLSYTSAEKSIVVNNLPSVSASPSSANYCYPGGNAVSLTASGANTYAWSPGQGLNVTTGSNVIASPISSITYTVVGTDGNGCSNIATAVITVGGIPQNLVATSNPANICSGSTSNLTASSAYYPTAVTVNNYLFSTVTGASLDPMIGATQVLDPGNDDIPSASPAEIGFVFNYDGTHYTQFSVSPDGWLLLGGATATTDFTNSVTDNLNVPKIYPYWDDLSTGIDGNVKTLVTGSAPYRIFIVQWFVPIPHSVSGNAIQRSSYGCMKPPNKIEFLYGEMGTPNLTNSSAGLTGATSTNFHSITFSSNTSSTITPNDLNKDAPSSGRKYIFSPPSVVISYSWTPGANVVSPSSQSTATNALFTTSTFTVTANNSGCTSTASATVTVESLLTVSATAYPASSICAGQSVTLTANPTGGGEPYSYSWKVGATPVSASQSFVVTPATTTTYNLTISDDCSHTATTSVTINVKPVPTANATNNSPICSGSTLNLTGMTDIGVTFIWTGPNNFTSSSQNPGISSVTYAADGTYSFSSALNGCTSNVSKTTVVINETPAPITVIPNTLTICSGDIQQLDATGGLTTATILNQNFNNPTNSWTTINNSYGGTDPALTAWTLQPDGYVYVTDIFHSNDNTQFYLSNSDAGGDDVITATILQSPAFNTLNYSAASVNFSHFLSYNSGTATLEASTDGATWTILHSFTSTQGDFAAFASANVPLTAPFLFGQPVVYIRFKYDTGWEWYWAIDNVIIRGSFNAQFTWSPTTYLYTDAAATIAYTGTVNPTVYIKPTGNQTYTVTASAFGCTNTTSLPVTVNSLVGPAGAISGTTTQGPGLTGQIYSITAVANATTYSWTVPPGWTITNGQGTTTITVTTGSVGQNGDIGVTPSNSCGNSSPQTLGVTISSIPKTLNLTLVMLEGLYSANGTMNKAMDEYGPHWGTGVADIIKIDLHDAANYSNVVYTVGDVYLSTTGNANVIIPASFSGSYYITIRHRNSVETTTATAVSFAGSTINQSFGAPANIYGGNLGLSNDNYYLIYAGDVNQDGYVDTDDYIGIDNDSYNYLSGYLDTDVNGDGLIDSGDYIAIDNNNYNYIGSSHP